MNVIYFPSFTKQPFYACGSFVQVVRKVAYDATSDTSVVECTPVHGRTHQIRLHLQVSELCFSISAGVYTFVALWLLFVFRTYLVNPQVKHAYRYRRLCRGIAVSPCRQGCVVPNVARWCGTLVVNW